MKIKDYKIIYDEMLQFLDEGIHVIDAQGKTILYNEAMARLEKMEQADVLEKPFSEIFPDMKEEESTLILALKNKVISQKKKQTYLNKNGATITTSNTTFPVVDNGQVIGAIEIAKDITEIQKMTNTILKLKNESANKAPKIKPVIRKYSFENICGQNERFLEIIDTAKRAATSNVSVLISGETGTGKELIAQSIHYESNRKDKPFLAQNCAALPENLLEGILFGTVKGGYTDAVDRAGLFEQASGGTLLLDEISAMPYDLQGKLLRVLQEDYVRPLGGTKDIPIDVRIIATINEPVSELIERGKLRKDLYYRINIVNIDVTPLRERKDDIIPLAEMFLEKHNKRNGKEVWLIDEAAKEKLKGYDYPGNVRELENTIMAALAMTKDDHVLTADHIKLPDTRVLAKTKASMAYDSSKDDLDSYMANIEEDIIRTTLRLNGWNISKSAAILGMKRQTLQHKMKKYGINV